MEKTEAIKLIQLQDPFEDEKRIAFPVKLLELFGIEISPDSTSHQTEYLGTVRKAADMESAVKDHDFIRFEIARLETEISQADCSTRRRDLRAELEDLKEYLSDE